MDPITKYYADHPAVCTAVITILSILLIFMFIAYRNATTSSFANPDALDPATKLLVAYHEASDPLYTPLGVHNRAECYIDPNDMSPGMRQAMKASLAQKLGVHANGECFIGMSPPISVSQQMLASAYNASPVGIEAALKPPRSYATSGAHKVAARINAKESFADANRKALIAQLVEKSGKKKENYEVKNENPALVGLLYGIKHP